MTWAAAVTQYPSSRLPKPKCCLDKETLPIHCNIAFSKTLSAIRSKRRASPPPFSGMRFSNNSLARSCRFGMPKPAIVSRSYCPNRKRVLQESPKLGRNGSGRQGWSQKPRTRLRFRVSPSVVQRWRWKTPAWMRQIWIDCRFVSRQMCFYATKIRKLPRLSFKKPIFAVWI